MSDNAFLTARWVDLLLATYAVPDALLTPLLPPGMALDRWEGRAMVSLVAFDFLDTRVMGVPWPGFVDFPELNLRFYVREQSGERRGVCFVREYVPSTMVATIARTLYNEPYVGARYKKDGADHVLHVGGREHRIGWSIEGEPSMAAEGSQQHFLKEHEWGFGQTRGGERLVYRVWHPHWRTWAGVTPRIDVDFGLLYGAEWAFLNDEEPMSVIVAEGSEIAVFKPER
jgi:hypothetical protein